MKKHWVGLSAVSLLVLTGCGGGGGTTFNTPFVPTLVSVSVNAPSASLRTTQSEQLTATAHFSDGTTADATSQATWSSDNNTAATVGANTGVATGVDNGTTHITASVAGMSASVTVTDVRELFGGAFSEVDVFDPAATGSATPLRTITGNVNTTLSNVDGLAASGTELFVADSAVDEIAVFDINANGDVAPKRIIKGVDTGLHAPGQIAVANGELFVANKNDDSVTVYPLTAHDDALPTRTIKGSTHTGLSQPFGLAIDNGLLFVGNSSGSLINVFQVTDSGDVAPQRSTTFSANNLGMTISGGKIFVCDFHDILAAPEASTGTVTPTQDLTGDGGPQGIQVSLGQLFAGDGDNSTIDVFNSTDTGSVSPLRRINREARAILVF